MQAILAGASRAALAAYIRRLSDCVGPPPQLPAAALAAARCGAGGPAAACVRAPADAAGHRRGEAALCLAGGSPRPLRAPRVVAVGLDVGGGSGAERVRVTLTSACGAAMAFAGDQPLVQRGAAPCVAAASALPRAAAPGCAKAEPPAVLPAGPAGHVPACPLEPRTLVPAGKEHGAMPSQISDRRYSWSQAAGAADPSAPAQYASKSAMMELLEDGLDDPDAPLAARRPAEALHADPLPAQHRVQAAAPPPPPLPPPPPPPPPPLPPLPSSWLLEHNKLAAARHGALTQPPAPVQAATPEKVPRCFR